VWSKHTRRKTALREIQGMMGLLQPLVEQLRLSSAVLLRRKQAGFSLRWRKIEGLILMAAKTPFME